MKKQDQINAFKFYIYQSFLDNSWSNYNSELSYDKESDSSNDEEIFEDDNSSKQCWVYNNLEIKELLKINPSIYWSIYILTNPNKEILFKLTNYQNTCLNLILEEKEGHNCFIYGYMRFKKPVKYNQLVQEFHHGIFWTSISNVVLYQEQHSMIELKELYCNNKVNTLFRKGIKDNDKIPNPLKMRLFINLWPCKKKELEEN